VAWELGGKLAVRFLRYFIGGFEALLAYFALMVCVFSLVDFVQLNLHPGVGAQRVVSVENTGHTLVGLIGSGVFGWWFGRLAVRNLRDASGKPKGIN
jgi:hypothetical protein